MSNALAIAAVTATLRSLLQQRLAANFANVNVSVQSPDRAAQDGGTQLNLFLYQTIPNAAWRNMDMPRQVKAGERGNPPLALNLMYLITAYSPQGANGDLTAHRLLGNALSLFHDHAVLRADDIRNATQGEPTLGDSDLDRQPEVVSLVPITLSLEEISKLWGTFQTPYRLSAVIQASVVLIESNRPTKVVLPVLQRGKGDRGVFLHARPDPILTGIEYREKLDQPKLPAAEVGRSIFVSGEFLPASDMIAVVRDPLRSRTPANFDNDVVAKITPTTDSPGTLKIKLNGATNNWPAGQLLLELRNTKPDNIFNSNAIPLLIAPQIKRDANAAPVALVDALNGKKLLTVALEHAVGSGRRITLLLNSIEENRNDFFHVNQLNDNTGSGEAVPAFDISQVTAGTYRLRVRTDGVDSLIMDTKNGIIEFDERMIVEVPP